MRIVNVIFAVSLGVSGCAAAPERVVKVEHAVVKNERQLVQIDESYDLSEQNLGRIRLSVFDLVERGRIVSQQLEQAAHDFQLAAMYNHLASNQFVRAAASFQRAANTYRQIASLIILAASSGRLLDVLCKQPTNTNRYRLMLGAFGVKLDDKNVEQLIPQILGKQRLEQRGPDQEPFELPLPAMNVLVKRATRMLLCEK